MNNTHVQSLHEDIDRTLQEHMRSKSAVGLAVGVVDQDNQYQSFHGTLRHDSTDAPDEDTMFELGTATGVFTAMLLAQMHLAGDVAFGSTVKSLLPPSLQSLSSCPWSENVTLWHLATHTSGLPCNASRFYRNNGFRNRSITEYTDEDFLRFLKSCRRKRAAGAETRVSHVGIALLGHLLAHAAQTSFEALLHDRVLEPLGMNETAIHLAPDQIMRSATGHLKSGRVASGVNMPVLAPACGLHSTLSDMLRFIQANCDPSLHPLKTAIEGSQHLHTEWSPIRDRWFVAPLAAILTLGITALDSSPTIEQEIAAMVGPVLLWFGWMVGFQDRGLGWKADIALHRGRNYWSITGSSSGYSTFIAVSPERRHGVVLLSNSSRALDSAGWEILTDLLQHQSNSLMASRQAEC